MVQSGIEYSTTDGRVRFIPKGVLMQSTGLCDSDGKEVFEGDILRVYSCYNDDELELNQSTVHEVRWFGEFDYPAFDLHPNKCDETNNLQMCIIGGDDYQRTEVIGNIHQN